MLELLDTLGRASGEALWLPVLAWTVLWLASEAASRFRTGVHPLVRYRATQAALFALPLGLALAPLIDAAAIAAWVVPPEVITVDASTFAAATPGPALLAPEAPTFAPTAWTALGALTLLAVAVGLVGLWRVARQAVALHRMRRLLPAPEATVGRARVVTTPAAPVPLTFGLWRPVIVLPAGLSAEGRALVLRHEGVHVKRRDALSAWAEALTAAVFGAHPGVRRLAERCDLLRELACDAALLAEPDVSRPAYASLVSAFASPEARLCPAVGMADAPSHVHQRITAMTLPVPLLRRTSAVLGWALSALLLVGASVSVTASRALAQEARVIVRTVEASEPPVLIVDGVRTDGSIADVSADTIHSVDVLSGEEAREAHGADTVIEITTKAEAARLGLGAPEAEVEVLTIEERPVQDGTVRIRSIDGPDSLRVALYHLRSRLDGSMVELTDDLRGPMIELTEELEVPLLRLREGLAPEVERLRESPVLRNLQGRLVEIIEIEEEELSGAEALRFRLRSDAVQGTPALKLDGIDEVFADGVASINIRNVDGARVVTLTSEDGTTRALRLDGPVTEAVRAADLLPRDGAKRAEASGAVSVAPNPATDAVTLRFGMESAGTARIRVYDVQGRLLTEDDLALGEGPQSHRFSVRDLAPGTYTYRIETGSGTPQSGRFTVAR